MVNNDDTKVRYRGNGSNRVFPITFPFNENDYICVRIANDVTGEVEELESGFLVDNIANTVTYPGWVSGQEPPVASQPAVLTSDETITIYRKTEISQLTELGIKFPLPQIEHALDKITNILQEHDEAIVRSVKVDISSDEEAGYYYERMMVASENAVNAAEEARTSANAARLDAISAGESYLDANARATAAATSATAAANSATAAANSATAAANSATAAANSATSAASSATAAATSATSAANSATAAANSATAAANSQSAAASSATSAAALEESSRTNAQVASSAATSCSQILPQVLAAKISAENSASAANTAKVAAALSAASAATDAETASNAATTATTKAGEAAASAVAAATSAASAADSATAASTSYDQAAVAVVNILDIVAEAAVTYPAQSGTQEYTGSVQTPNWDSYYQSNKMVITGDTSATNAGTYTVTFTPKSGYYWLADDTTTAKTQTWTISRATVANVPAQSNVLVYDGTVQTPTWSNYDSSQLTISGDTSGTDADTYTVTFTPTANYKWYDGTTTAKSVTWTINSASVTIPTVTNTSKTYNGQPQAPTVTGLDALTVDVIDDASATDAGSYMITFHLKSASLHWSDLTTADKSVAWTIGPKSVTAPTVTDTSKTYNGDSQGPTISSFDANEIVMSGTSSAVTAGSYSVIFSLASAINYVWSDSTTAAKSTNWSIAKLAGSMSLSKSSVSLDMSNLTDTVTVTRTGDGVITATSADPSIATASVSGNVITITAIANGSTTITVSVAAGTNYLAPADQNISVTASLVSTTLNDNSWAIISAIAQAGQGANYWNIGDCKEVTLNGKIGNFFTASNLTLCVFILDFNHKNNGVSDNNIIFGCFKNALTGGKDIALADSNHGSSFIDGTKHFNMNHWGNYNYGGWKGSDLRYDILGATSSQPSDYGRAHTTSCVGYDATDATITNPKSDTFLAALPSDLRSVLRLWDRWVDVKGNKSDTNANVQKTVDAVSLLAEFELFGVRTYANQYEKDHQSQMTYYSNGNSRVKYRNDDTSSAKIYWECSPSYKGTETFCFVGSNGASGGSSGDGGARYPYLLAPAFKV